MGSTRWADDEDRGRTIIRLDEWMHGGECYKSTPQAFCTDLYDLTHRLACNLEGTLATGLLKKRADLYEIGKAWFGVLHFLRFPESIPRASSGG